MAQIPTARTFDHPGELLIEFDRFANVTKVSTGPGGKSIVGPLTTATGSATPLSLLAFYLFEGERVTELPERVTLLLTSAGRDPWGPGPRGLALLADGKPVPVDELLGEPFHSPELQFVFLSTTGTMRLSDFLTLVNASQVEGRSWGHEFKLTHSQMEVLRDLASRLRPAATAEAQR